jgi:hypothetical protein
MSFIFSALNEELGKSKYYNLDPLNDNELDKKTGHFKNTKNEPEHKVNKLRLQSS